MVAVGSPLISLSEVEKLKVLSTLEPYAKKLAFYRGTH